MYIKKVISCSMAIILTVLGVVTGFFDCRTASASEIDYTQIFDFNYTAGSENYTAYIKRGYDKYLKTNNISELIIPETYNDGEHGEAPVNYGSSTLWGDYVSVVTSIKYNSSSRIMSSGILGTFVKVDRVDFLYSGKDFTLGSRIAINDSFNASMEEEGDPTDYCKTLEDVYINADTITLQPDTFAKINEQVTIHVTNEIVKRTIVNTTKDGSAPILESQIKIEAGERTPSEFTISCENIYVGTENGFSPVPHIITGDSEAEIEYRLYEDEAGTIENKSFNYQQSNLPEGTYYIKAIMYSTDQYIISESNVVAVKVEKNKPVDKKALETAIADASTFFDDNKYKQENYQESDWKKVFGSGGTLELAKEIFAGEEGRYNQEQVNTATTNLTDALTALKSSKPDNSAAWKELQEEITKAEAYLSKQDEYTEESWTRINPQNRINTARALKQEEATVAQITTQISLLKGIATGLELKPKEPEVTPGNPFAFIPKKGAEVKVLSMTAPESLAGATKVRVTFKCADDTSFNEYASIDLNPIIAGVDNYKQIQGTGDYATGTTHTVEVPLSAAIKAGDSIELRMATYAWDGAADWVYGVTAIEFLDADDKVLGSYIDKDVFKANLASAITEAEAINTSTYTEESVKKLTDAIAAAKALTAEATAEEMSKAIDAINEAIKGLQKKDEDTEAAKEKLTAAQKEAEAIDASLYTSESYEALKKALDAAKALKDDATLEEIEKAAQAITDAIKGLVKKDDSSLNTPQPSQDPNTPGDETKVDGYAKGKTFTAGSFKYKVSVAATITGTVKTPGKVVVVGLSSADKKKSSINVKNTISVSGVSYQVTGIGSKAFRKAPKLKKATLGTNVKSIPTSAFEGCKKLTTVKMTGVTKIGSKAFKGCKVLKKLTFGKKKLTSVKKGAFKGCKKKIKVAGGSKKVKKGNLKKLKKSGYKKFK